MVLEFGYRACSGGTCWYMLVLTRSNAVEQALGWVQQKIGFMEAMLSRVVSINQLGDCSSLFLLNISIESKNTELLPSNLSFK
jgi:hypothetical protein